MPHSDDGGMIHVMQLRPCTRFTIGFLALLSPSALFAQGCAMCYQTAAGSGPQFIQALRHGILIMFFPPILIMGAILYAAYRKRNQFNSAKGAASPDAALYEDVAPDWTATDNPMLRGFKESAS